MKRVLFVDDEPNILQGLRRMLHSQRHEWEMVFANSGAEALSAMAETPFDVVVSDMRMPGMTGAELLSKVKDQQPNTVRLVLSGQSDAGSAMRSVSVSHQFLAKPCDTDSLREAIVRACNLEHILANPRLQETLGSVAELPVLPEVYQQLCTALVQPEIGVADISALVEKDLGIAAKILQLVNSSYFGIKREISDLHQATTYLGVATIRDLVLSFGTFQQLERHTMPPGFSLAREQRHAMVTAHIAKQLLDDKTESDQAFLAGMLHDVGKLVLAAHVSGPYRTVLEFGAGRTCGFDEAERKVIGIGHGEVGAYLLGLWGLPYPVVEAVAHHHDPARVTAQTRFGLLGAVHVANVLAQEQDDNSGRSQLDMAYLDGLGVLDRLPEWRELAARETDGEGVRQ